MSALFSSHKHELGYVDIVTTVCVVVNDGK